MPSERKGLSCYMEGKGILVCEVEEKRAVMPSKEESIHAQQRREHSCPAKKRAVMPSKEESIHAQQRREHSCPAKKRAVMPSKEDRNTWSQTEEGKLIDKLEKRNAPS